MNSNKKIVRVNVMLGSLFYRILRTETAAEKLALRIDPQTLTIFDTWLMEARLQTFLDD